MIGPHKSSCIVYCVTGQELINAAELISQRKFRNKFSGRMRSMKIFTQIMTPKIATIAEADEESDKDSEDEGTTD